MIHKTSHSKAEIFVFQIVALVFVLYKVPIVSLSINPTMLGNIVKIFCVFTFVFFINKYKSKRYSSVNIYLTIMLVAFLLHTMFPTSDLRDKPFWESIKWAVIVFLIALSIHFKKCYLVLLLLIIFYLLQSGMSFYERLTESNLIDYSSLAGSDDKLAFRTADDYLDFSVFRSCALLGHGLDNANVTSIIMAFILSSRLNNSLKWILIFIGLIALWGFNSRAAIGVWMIILIYRLVFYKHNSFYALFAAFASFLVIPYIVEFIVQTGLLGRFNFDFSDDSSETRLLAFNLFWLQDWTLERIISGGYIIYMPGSNLSLENGVLLNLSYWGWIIGTLKIILEVWISYKFLPKFLTRSDKFIIVLATWGVAFANNNSFGSLIITFYMISIIGFTTLDNLIKPRSTRINIDNI